MRVLLKVRANVAFMLLMVRPLFLYIYYGGVMCLLINEKMPNDLMRLAVCFFGGSTNFSVLSICRTFNNYCYLDPSV